jgi:hypothetical protein
MSDLTKMTIGQLYAHALTASDVVESAAEVLIQTIAEDLDIIWDAHSSETHEPGLPAMGGALTRLQYRAEVAAELLRREREARQAEAVRQ